MSGRAVDRGRGFPRPRLVSGASTSAGGALPLPACGRWRMSGRQDDPQGGRVSLLRKEALIYLRLGRWGGRGRGAWVVRWAGASGCLGCSVGGRVGVLGLFGGAGASGCSALRSCALLRSAPPPPLRNPSCAPRPLPPCAIPPALRAPSIPAQSLLRSAYHRPRSKNINARAPNGAFLRWGASLPHPKVRAPNGANLRAGRFASPLN